MERETEIERWRERKRGRRHNYFKMSVSVESVVSTAGNPNPLGPLLANFYYDLYWIPTAALTLLDGSNPRLVI